MKGEVKRLLALDGVNVHADDNCAFRCACSCDRLEVVKLLLAMKGDRRIDVRARQNLRRLGQAGGDADDRPARRAHTPAFSRAKVI